MGLLEIDETKKDDKKEEEQIDEELYDDDFSVIDPFTINSVLEQTIEMQNDLKQIEEEKRREEQERKEKNDKKPSSGPSLGVLELLEEVRIPNLDEFSKNPDKNAYPAVINGSLNPLTGRTEEFRDNLINKNLDILQDYQKFVFELVEIYNSGFVVDFPQTPLTASKISNKKIDSIKDLLININFIQQSTDFIEYSLKINYSNELQEELNELKSLSNLYNNAINSLSKNLNLYINYKGEQ